MHVRLARAEDGQAIGSFEHAQHLADRLDEIVVE